jgi:hypothetical protein
MIDRRSRSSYKTLIDSRVTLKLWFTIIGQTYADTPFSYRFSPLEGSKKLLVRLFQSLFCYTFGSPKPGVSIILKPLIYSAWILVVTDLVAYLAANLLSRFWMLKTSLPWFKMLYNLLDSVDLPFPMFPTKMTLWLKLLVI